jgi:hypothetical protein
MKKFKLYDTWISITLIIAFTVLSLIRLDYTFIIGYFTIGIWQIISMIIHSVKGWFSGRGTARGNYHFTVVIIFILVFAGLVISPLLMILLYVMLFAAPIMALYYTTICYNEIYVKMQRPLAVLK